MNVFFLCRGCPGQWRPFMRPREWRGCGSLFINRASEIFGIQLERKENPGKYSVQIQKFKNQMVEIQMVDYKIPENIPFEYIPIEYNPFKNEPVKWNIYRLECVYG